MNKEIFFMNCQKCGSSFQESEIQVSHDVPKYLGGKDKDGRHNLCKKCHDIYEKSVFSWVVSDLPENLREAMREKAKRFAKIYFPKEGENE